MIIPMYLMHRDVRKMKRTIRSLVGEVTIRENGIVVARTYPKVNINLRDATEYLAMVAYLSRGKPHAIVIDISDIGSIDLNAKAFLMTESNGWGKTVAMALISNGHTAQMVGRSFLAANRPEYPVQIFRELTEGYHWARIEYLRRTTRIAS